MGLWPELSGVADADLAVLLVGVAKVWGLSFVIRTMLQLLRSFR